MYSIDSNSSIAREFCKLLSEAIKEKKIFTVTHEIECELSNKPGQHGHGQMVEERIYINNPCCLSHALQDLEDSFREICEDQYGVDVEPRSYFLEQLDVILNDDQEVEIELSCGT